MGLECSRGTERVYDRSVRGRGPRKKKARRGWMGGVLRDKTNLALERETQIARLTAVYLFSLCLNVSELFGK